MRKVSASLQKSTKRKWNKTKSSAFEVDFVRNASTSFDREWILQAYSWYIIYNLKPSEWRYFFIILSIVVVAFSLILASNTILESIIIHGSCFFSLSFSMAIIQSCITCKLQKDTWCLERNKFGSKYFDNKWHTFIYSFRDTKILSLNISYFIMFSWLWIGF